MKVALFLVCASVVLHANGKSMGNQLLMGKMIGQGDTKAEALGDTDIGRDVKEVKGKEVAKGADESIAPENELMMGESLGEFNKKPSAADLKVAFKKENIDPNTAVENKKGQVLDNDVQSGSYVANPAMVLGEVLSSGAAMPEIVEGEIIAGDAAEVDVLTMPN